MGHPAHRSGPHIGANVVGRWRWQVALAALAGGDGNVGSMTKWRWSRWQVVFSTIAQALAPFYQTLEIFFFRLSDFLVQLVCGKRGDGAMVDLDGKRQRAASPHASAIPRPRPHRAYFWTCVRVL